MEKQNLLKIALAQIAPVWLNKRATIDKVKTSIEKAAKEKAELIVFGEALLPGYPFWLGLTGGAAFNSEKQKTLHAHYVNNAIQVESGELNEICLLAKKHRIAIYLGFIERAKNRGGHSLYCSLAYINMEGEIQSVHRKLQPTYEERLTWSLGDGHGLRVHTLKAFTVGGLNCWENWMPLPRTALYGQGENLHIAVWPGSVHNTDDITRFIAKEGRSFVVSVGCIMHKSDFPAGTPYLDEILANSPELLTNGGSCIAGPDGRWIQEPIADQEGVFYAEIDFSEIYKERQNFDGVGHYSRPDVTQLHINRERQQIIKITD